MSARFTYIGSLCLVAATGFLAAPAGDVIHRTGTDSGWKQHDAHRPRPEAVEPAATPSTPPKDAVVLFDGSSLDAWQGKDGGKAEWTVKDGAMVVAPGKGPIRTKAKFGDVQLHVEWASPDPPKGKGQDRGNSGIFLMDQFEIQVLDSYKTETYADGQAGAIYGQYPPLFNASKPPGAWQTYDIAFRRPRFDKDGKLLEAARVTVIHNGILVQNNEEILGPTYWLHWGPYEAGPDAGPIELQDHGHPVKFRNMWVRNMPVRPAPSASDMKKPNFVSLSESELDRFAGEYRMGESANAAKVKITRSGGHLLVKFPFLPISIAIEPTSETSFAMPHTDGRFAFRKDDTGKVTGAKFEIGDGERELKRVEK